jgi:hypothetical protein
MTEKVDVFAFGVVVLETVAGRPNYCDKLDEDRAYLLEWVRSPIIYFTAIYGQSVALKPCFSYAQRTMRNCPDFFPQNMASLALKNIYGFQAWQLYEDDHPLDVTDVRLTEFNSEEVLRAIRVGLLCIQSSPRQRPPMSRVVSMLVGDTEVPQAVTKPSYVTEWQSNATGTSSSDAGAKAMSASPFLSSVIDEGR